MRSEHTLRPGVSPNVRRWTKIIFVGGLVAVLGFSVLVDFVETRSMDFRSAEEVYADLRAGGFECEDPYFPSGSSEGTDTSSATCSRGNINVHVYVNTERGRWLGVGGARSYESGEAFVTGNNWSVSFEASNEDSLELPRKVQAILGGEIVKSEVRPEY